MGPRFIQRPKFPPPPIPTRDPILPVIHFRPPSAPIPTISTPFLPTDPEAQSFIEYLLTTLSMSDDVRTLKCVLVGEEAVGKTSLIVSYTTNGFSDKYTPTAFDNYSVVVRVDKKPIRVQLCDTAGQSNLDSLRTLTYPDCDVFIVVYNVLNPESFKKVVDRWIPEINKSNHHTPIVLVGTQTDRRWSALDSQTVSTAKGKSLAAQIKAVDFFEVSSLTKGNVKMMFDAAIVAGLEGRRVAPKKSRLRQGFQRFVSITKKVF